MGVLNCQPVSGAFRLTEYITLRLVHGVAFIPKRSIASMDANKIGRTLNWRRLPTILQLRSTANEGINGSTHVSAGVSCRRRRDWLATYHFSADPTKK